MKHRFCVIVAALLSLFLWNAPLNAKGKPAVAVDSPESNLVQDVASAFQAHDYKKVIALYREFAVSKPERSLPLVVKVLYSQSLADTGEIDDAIEALRGILFELPAEVDPLQLQYDLANLLFLQKRYDEAKTVYSRLLLRGNRSSQILSQAKNRLGMLKEREGSKKKDFDSLEMMDLETAVDAGEVPEGAAALLEKIVEQNPKSPQAEEAKRLQARVKDLRIRKAQALLDEARRLFDVEKKYVEVTEVLDALERSYGDVSEKPSIEALRKAVASKTGKPAER